jgi:integrase
MLTDKTIRDARPKQSVYRLRDTKSVCRGLGIAVAPSGAKSFFLSFTSPEDGKRKQINIGKFPFTGLAEARRKALELRGKVDQGIDPVIEKTLAVSNRLATRTLGTFSELIDLYIENLIEDGKRSAKEVQRIKNKDIPNHFLKLPAHTIDREIILDILSAIAQRGAKIHSDNVRAYLHAAFELGIHANGMTRWRGKIKQFNLAINPVTATKRSVTRKRKGQRTLSEKEVYTLWQSNILSPSMHAAVKLILAFGQRVEEVLHSEWSEFDFEKMLWVIPGKRRKTRAKTDEPHVVPITQFHMSLLDEAKLLSQHSIYVFPSTKKDAPRRYDSLTNAVSKYVNKSGMNSFSPRDLRRTFKTLSGSMGISIELRNRLQGHALQDVGSVYYDRYDYLDEKRQAMAVWINGLSKMVTIKE